MTRIGSHYFLCLNNSDKIAVIDTGNWRLTGSISIPQPRYILQISDSKAFVSTLYSNKVYVINPQNLQVTDTIMMPCKNAENMLLAGAKAILCGWDTAAHSLTTIDPATNNITGALALPNGSPADVLQDKEGALWVLTGNVTQGHPAMITRMDAGSGAVLHNYPLPPAADPLRLCFNPTKDTLYWIEANYTGGNTDNGIFRIGIHENSLPASPFIAAQPLEYFWAVGIDPASSNIYVGNPLGFTQQGSVQVYSPAGVLLKTFKVGVGPGHFYFVQ